MNRQIDYNITKEYEGQKISAFLKKINYPESCLTKLRHIEGSIKVNGNTVHMNYRFSFTDTDLYVLSIFIREESTNEKIVPIKGNLNIVYEDEDIIVLNKDAFTPVHPSMGHYENTLANYLAWYYKEKNIDFTFRCITRLDRDTTGLVLVAKHYLAAGILASSMQTKSIKKEYMALVSGTNIPDKGTIDKPIAREKESVITRHIDYDNGESAITHYETIKKYDDYCLVRLCPETGRTHQIRVHMLSIGHPLLGDFLYNPEDKHMNHQALHASRLTFTHPITGKVCDFYSEPLFDVSVK